MSASDVNLSAIINIKHRAIIQALISTNLNITEIAAKLQTTTGSIYYAVGRYLYKGYLEQRAREIELEKLKSCAVEGGSQEKDLELIDNSGDEVTVIELSEPEEAPAVEVQTQLAIPQIQKTQDTKSEQVGTNLYRSQQYIYDLIDKLVKSHPRHFIPRRSKVYSLSKKERGVGFSSRDFAAAKKKWCQEHPSQSGGVIKSSNQNHTSVEVEESKAQQQTKSEDNLLKIEYRGQTLSLNCNRENFNEYRLVTLIKSFLFLNEKE